MYLQVEKERRRKKEGQALLSQARQSQARQSQARRSQARQSLAMVETDAGATVVINKQSQTFNKEVKEFDSFTSFNFIP